MDSRLTPLGQLPACPPSPLPSLTQLCPSCRRPRLLTTCFPKADYFNLHHPTPQPRGHSSPSLPPPPEPTLSYPAIGWHGIQFSSFFSPCVESAQIRCQGALEGKGLNAWESLWVCSRELSKGHRPKVNRYGEEGVGLQLPTSRRRPALTK